MEWARAVAQLAGEAPPQPTWPAERITRVSSGTPDEAAPVGGLATPVRAAADAALLQALADGPLTVAQLRVATCWPKTTLAGRLASALDRGVVTRARFGVYVVGIAAERR